MNEPVPITDSSLILTLFNGTVPCGFPSPAADYLENRIDLNAHLLLNRDASYLFRVRGKSMEGVGIFDGDTVVVDKSLEALHRRIVLAIVDNAFTIKRLYKLNNVVQLLSEHPDYPPITFKEGQELRIWGVATFNLRRLLY
jgi:DNA polymerase V